MDFRMAEKSTGRNGAGAGAAWGFRRRAIALSPLRIKYDRLDEIGKRDHPAARSDEALPERTGSARGPVDDIDPKETFAHSGASKYGVPKNAVARREKNEHAEDHKAELAIGQWQFGRKGEQPKKQSRVNEQSERSLAEGGGLEFSRNWIRRRHR